MTKPRQLDAFLEQFQSGIERLVAAFQLLDDFFEALQGCFEIRSLRHGAIVTKSSCPVVIILGDMKSHCTVACFVLWIVLSLASCAPKPEPTLDHATVVARNASVRIRNSSTSRTLVTLNVGDKVDVLERQDNWYRIRQGTQLQGWMEESTIVTNNTLARVSEMATESQSQRPQNTGALRDDANLRLDPGRSTSIIRRLDSGTKLEVLERVTTPRPGSDSSKDMWLKVRITPTEVGWVYAGLVDFDIPFEIAQYSEGYAYSAVKIVNQVQDPVAGPIHWYVVGEKRSGIESDLDFNGLRVFTWNLKLHRFETAYRLRGIRGVYPLEVGQASGNPTFRYYELGEDGKSRIPHDFVMYGVVTRPLNSTESAEKSSRRQ
jgi:SH3-like domain-containing protein